MFTLTRRPSTADRPGHMGKVTNHQAAVDGDLALDARARTTALALVGSVGVCGVDAEIDGVGGVVDGDEAGC